MEPNNLSEQEIAIIKKLFEELKLKENPPPLEPLPQNNEKKQEPENPSQDQKKKKRRRKKLKSKKKNQSRNHLREKQTRNSQKIL